MGARVKTAVYTFPTALMIKISECAERISEFNTLQDSFKELATL
jgi:hypothetical protein